MQKVNLKAKIRIVSKHQRHFHYFLLGMAWALHIFTLSEAKNDNAIFVVPVRVLFLSSVLSSNYEKATITVSRQTSISGSCPFLTHIWPELQFEFLFYYNWQHTIKYYFSYFFPLSCVV